MGRRLSAALALTCWLVAGCTYTPYPAETSALACINGGDDDDDGLQDCADPDCWGFASCRVKSDAAAPFVPPALPDASWPPLGPPYYAPQDSSTPHVMPDAEVPDPPPDAEVDAELPPECDKGCPLGECRADGACNVPLVFGEYAVESIELFAPRQAGQACLDAPEDVLFPCVRDSLLSPCCFPDIKVVVHVDGTKLGWVDEANVYQMTWDSPELMPFELREGHEVRFDVADEDKPEVGDFETEVSEQPIFGCTTFVDKAAVRSGRIDCKPDRPAGADYRVSATIARRGGGSAEGGDEP